MTGATLEVLIVDDDLDIRETLADVLQDRGFVTTTAANGLEALQLLRRGPAPPSVIVLDLMMPIMDGYEFLQERAKDPALRTIPLAIVTAGHRVDTARLGAGTTIIPKPINLPKLITVLRDLAA